jgi:autotransporter-associated beta strand protein
LGDWSPFAGRLVLATDADGGDFRIGTNYAPTGFPHATVHLNDRVWLYHTGILAGGTGTTLRIGALSGDPLARVMGGVTGGRNLTVRAGESGADTTFAGTIAEQNSSTSTTWVKTGTGTWTLSGTGSWNGATIVEQGTLRITGTIACAAATIIEPAATLALDGGALATDTVAVAAGATLAAHGRIDAGLDLKGTLVLPGQAGAAGGALTVHGPFFMSPDAVCRMAPASDILIIAGDAALSGTIHVYLPSPSFGRHTLISVNGALEGLPALSGPPPTTNAHLSTSLPGRLDLVIDDLDEDGLPDSWEIARFGSLGQGPDDNPDGDNSTNLAEFRLGLDPNSAASAFRATLSGRTLTWPSAPGVLFTVKRSLTLGAASWTVVGTITGPPGQTTASFTDPENSTRAFYLVAFTP